MPDPSDLPPRKPERIELVDGSLTRLGDELRERGPFDRLVLAEGDSWFDLFTPLPLREANLLEALRLPGRSAIVDCARIGDTAAAIAGGWQAAATVDLLDDTPFDAILLSAGGNDLKSIFAARLASEVIEARRHAQPAARLKSRAREALAARDPIHDVVDAIGRFVQLRDGSRRNARTPIVLHGYDVFQPRPAPPRVIGLAGPRDAWIWPILRRAGLDDTEMLDEVRQVLGTLDDALRRAVAGWPEVHLVRQVGTLAPAPAGSNGPAGDWADEIHPSEQGFRKLAALWNPLLQSLLRRPRPPSN